MRNALMTMNLYGDTIRRAARASLRDAATRWRAEYIEVIAPLYDGRDAYREKLALERHAFGFDRVVYCDRDVVIRKDCPSLFDIVPAGWLGAVPSEQEGHNLLHHIRPKMEPLAAAAAARLDLEREYFNSGILVFEPRAHARVFERARALTPLAPDLTWEVHDQGLLSLAVKLEVVPLLALPPTFNRCGAVVWDRWVPTMSDYVWHFCSMGNPEALINGTRWDDLGPERWDDGMKRWEFGKPFGFANHNPDETPFLARELSKLWGETIVEVGTYMGGSAWLIVLLTHLRGCHTYCVDPWDGSTDIQHSPEEWEAVYRCFLRNLEDLNFGRHLTVLRQSSVQAACSFDDESVGLVFIDANPDVDSVSADIAAWWPKLKRGGVMLGHDYSPSFPGVIDAVNTRFGSPEELSEGWFKIWKVTRPA
jgi:predicted O-methyltransferase YrrM